MSKYIDNININDEIGPHGLVIIKDKAGNILVKKHNMVVKGGKEIVYNKLLETSGFSQDKRDSNWKLAKLYFGNSMNETTYNYLEIDKISLSQNGEEVIYYSYDLTNKSSESGYASIVSFGSTTDGHPYIEFNLSGILCDPEKAAYLSCLSVVAEEIVANNSSGTQQKLFSRIKFDPIPMVEGNELTLLYYIYF